MKKCLIFIPLIVGSNALLAQSEGLWTMQLNYASAFTSHLKKPSTTYSCFEGCLAQEQRGRISPSLSYALNRKVGLKSAIMIELGYLQYSFNEFGEEGTGAAGQFAQFERTLTLEYLTVGFGYRRYFTPIGPVQFFSQLLLHSDFVPDQYSDVLDDAGTALRGQVGFITTLDQQVNFSLAPYFKTAIANYNKQYFDNPYLPYAIGLEFAINIEM